MKKSGQKMREKKGILNERILIDLYNTDFLLDI
jgi:hypothetical protein